MNTKQYFAFFCPWLSLFIPYLVILDTSSAEEKVGENLDAKIAFDVPGIQQPISFASGDQSMGFIVYCPCMGKWRNFIKTFNQNQLLTYLILVKIVEQIQL